MEPNKEYYAFISYKREDEKWAKWLQHKLEHYQRQNAQLAEERDNVLKANWRMMENRARFVAAKGQELIDNHDSYTARLLALAILPDSLNNPNVPYVVEAEAMLRNAMMRDDGVLKGHTTHVNSVAFSPDGKRIVSGASDGTVRIWEYPPLQDLIDETRRRFKDRQLTPEERREYYLD